MTIFMVLETTPTLDPSLTSERLPANQSALRLLNVDLEGTTLEDLLMA